MRFWPVLLSACGRISFDAHPDATPDVAIDAPIGMPMLVQVGGGQVVSMTQDVQLGKKSGAGNLIVVVCGTLTPLLSVSDDAGNPYTQTIAYENPDSSTQGYLWWTIAAQPAKIIHTSFAQAMTHTVDVLEYAGIGGATGSSTGHAASGTALDTGAVAANPGDLLVAFTHQNIATTWTEPAGWMLRADNMHTFVIDRTADAVAGFDAMIASSNDQPWDAHVVAFGPEK